jgi:MOSC domain-containing protein YiiM
MRRERDTTAMRVISVNVGAPRMVRWKGREITTAIFKEPVSGRVPIRRLNVHGDTQADLAVHGGPAKAVYAYPMGHYAYWREELGERLCFGAFGENLTIRGLPLENDAAIGDRFRVGSAELVVTQPRLPCYKLAVRFGRADMVKRFLVSGRTGYYLAVATEGEVAAGDTVERTTRHSAGITVADVTRVYLSDRDHLATIKRLARLDALPVEWRQHFIQRLASQARGRSGSARKMSTDAGSQ